MSNRIYLRESTVEDCILFGKWETSPEVTKFFTISDDWDYEKIKEEFLSRVDNSSHAQFTICLKESDKPIGRIQVSNINYHYDSLDITRIYIGDVENRGKGLGEEALREIVKWAFTEMNCERVTLDHLTENVRAKNLYLKVGFVPEGRMRHSGKKNGEYVDLNLMSILKEEYEKLYCIKV